MVEKPQDVVIEHPYKPEDKMQVVKRGAPLTRVTEVSPTRVDGVPVPVDTKIVSTAGQKQP